MGWGLLTESPYRLNVRPVPPPPPQVMKKRRKVDLSAALDKISGTHFSAPQEPKTPMPLFVNLDLLKGHRT